MEQKGYSIFLMVELARLCDLIDRELEYDLTWKRATDLYEEFQTSEFNKDTESEYECIWNFLSNQTLSNR